MKQQNFRVILGVAVCDLPAKDSPVVYQTWKAMLQRCYAGDTYNSAYLGCAVCKEWLTYSNYKLWYDLNSVPGWEIDKDLLIEGNKVYGPEGCVFLPKYLNGLFKGKNTGRLLKGVLLVRSGRFQARAWNHGVSQALGTYETEEQAHVIHLKQTCMNIHNALIGYRKDINIPTKLLERLINQNKAEVKGIKDKIRMAFSAGEIY